MLENKLGLVNQITKLLAKERSLPALYAIIHFYPYGTESLQIFDTEGMKYFYLGICLYTTITFFVLAVLEKSIRLLLRENA